jgi:hypothetical protein
VDWTADGWKRLIADWFTELWMGVGVARLSGDN